MNTQLPTRRTQSAVRYVASSHERELVIYAGPRKGLGTDRAAYCDRFRAAYGPFTAPLSDPDDVTRFVGTFGVITELSNGYWVSVDVYDHRLPNTSWSRFKACVGPREQAFSAAVDWLEDAIAEANAWVAAEREALLAAREVA